MNPFFKHISYSRPLLGEGKHKKHPDPGACWGILWNIVWPSARFWSKTAQFLSSFHPQNSRVLEENWIRILKLQLGHCSMKLTERPQNLSFRVPNESSRSRFVSVASFGMIAPKGTQGYQVDLVDPSLVPGWTLFFVLELAVNAFNLQTTESFECAFEQTSLTNSINNSYTVIIKSFYAKLQLFCKGTNHKTCFFFCLGQTKKQVALGKNPAWAVMPKRSHLGLTANASSKSL